MESKIITKQTKAKKVLPILSLICGVFGGYQMSTFSLIAVILGHIALVKIKRQPEKFGGKGFAIAGLIFGYFGLILMATNTVLKYRLDKSLDENSGKLSEISEIKIDKDLENSEIIGNMYRNNKYGFRIKFPDGWKIEVGDGKHIVQKATSNNSSIMVTVFQLDLAGENGFSSIKDFGSAKEYVDYMIESPKEKFSDVKILDYGETKIDNQPSYWFEYSATSQVLDYQVKITNIIYSLATGDIIYSIQGGSPTDEYVKMKPDFVKSVATFVLEN